MSCLGCTQNIIEYDSDQIFTWCTNCGNYGISAALKRALTANDISPDKILLCFDIGCNGNGSDKIAGYRFHGLHGRVLPFAVGAHLANQHLPVIASAGDGATLSEGLNHFIHAIRHNYNITFILHNNHNYALTKGQASSTTPLNNVMDSNPYGVDADPIDPSLLALDMGGSFIARGYSADVQMLTELIAAGINHPGFSLIEIRQDCPTYNKAYSHEWYMERVYPLENTPIDRAAARELLLEQDKIATGIIFQDKSKPDFYAKLENRKEANTALIQEVVPFELNGLLTDLR